MFKIYPLSNHSHLLRASYMPGTMGAEDASINRLICPHGSQSLLERKVELIGGREARSVVAMKWRHCWKRHIRECNDHRRCFKEVLLDLMLGWWSRLPVGRREKKRVLRGKKQHKWRHGLEERQRVLLEAPDYRQYMESSELHCRRSLSGWGPSRD